MKRNSGILVAALAAIASSLAITATASAAPKTVCPSGCAFTSIQAAIEAASPGATITIGAGSYEENVVVTKSVTLTGAGNKTIIYPATSNPICSPGSLCEGAASNIILVQADNVTITKLQLKGDNPSLTSGVVVGGEDLDARNGIITNHSIGTFNNLSVSKVKVTGIYLRGIYASSGGTFNFTKDNITNVQGEEASIAMFNFGGSGVMSDNKVTSANDGISSNHSTGTQYIHNTVMKSGSGVHTDNNGDSGGVADVIKENSVKECNQDGFGVWVFVPYLSPKVEKNKVKGCYVGLAAFGGAVPGEGPVFEGNKVSGVGATTTDPNGTYGAYLTTDQLGFEFGDLNATLTANSFMNSGTGMLATQTSPTEGQPAGGQATVNAEQNSITGNGTGANGETGTVFNGKNNWWGCPAGPNMGGSCQTVVGTVTFTPWLGAKP